VRVFQNQDGKISLKIWRLTVAERAQNYIGLPSTSEFSPSTCRLCSSRISSAMLVRDNRTSSANGALGRHERHDSAGMRPVTAASRFLLGYHLIWSFSMASTQLCETDALFDARHAEMRPSPGLVSPHNFAMSPWQTLPASFSWSLVA
jgi:hypothetical protein